MTANTNPARQNADTLIRVMLLVLTAFILTLLALGILVHGGRIMVGPMMLVGISLFSIITAWIASKIVAPEEQLQQAELLEQLTALNKRLDALAEERK